MDTPLLAKPLVDGAYLGQLPDADAGLTAEWVDSLDAVIGSHGPAEARLILGRLLRRAAERGVGFPTTVTTPYVNTISRAAEPDFPGNDDLERRIEALVVWNTAVMVSRANASPDGLGGHIATPASSASLYEVGFNHFFRGKDGDHPGDQVFFQGHAAPGIYARAFLEGRLGESQLDGFRRETAGGGLSSYPHPRLMPEFWEFPTVSMGLGPINAVYQARFNRYLQHRGIADTSASHVWCFIGDGECDEPETSAALTLAARDRLDNLTFVVNCNLQRLDGPVRGNGKVIQELEGVFRGAGWNVIKVIWGSAWDDLLARDHDGSLLDRMNTTIDGEYQKFAVEPPAYARDQFFGGGAGADGRPDDDPVFAMPRGGHDRRKVFAAYQAAMDHRGSPTVILAKTVKGFGLGTEIQARNAAHQIKKMKPAQFTALRDRLGLAELVPDDAFGGGDEPPRYVRPADGSPEHDYLMGRRRDLGGALPRHAASRRGQGIGQPDPKVFDDLLEGSNDRAVSTTMAFAGLLRSLLRDPTIGSRVVPIVPDEARTFGLDALFSEVKIYAPHGQQYEPVDGAMQLAYRESTEGQILEEGITEAGSLSSFTAAGTSYSTWGEPMIPFYLFYSMFGFQRVGDQVWAFGDMRGRGFLLGATAGRTTLNGEGLQHQDGHSLLLASTVPNVAAYDPAFAYEVATIVRDGIARMYGDEPEDVFYYLTLYNENYPMPPMPSEPDGSGVKSKRAADGIVRGAYQFAPPPDEPTRAATILFSGTAQAAAREARALLAEHHDVAAELWSVTSYKALREDALAAERWNRLHPNGLRRTPYLTDALADCAGPYVAVTDFMKAVPDQVARWIPGHYTALGTDGYGRSDSRSALRRHFETDAAHVVVAVLAALVELDNGKVEEVEDAIERYGLDADAIEPRLA